MSNRKSTKRALLGSIMAMVLCLAMLVGATFAWFTDTASTGVNKIQAGKLDVALEMKDAAGQWVSAEGKTLDFVKAAAGEQVLWEPGCTYTLPELRVVNNGNLALKYKVVITGINGSAKLNEAIEWTIGDVAMGAEQHLAAGEGNAFTIKGHMKESAGNDYMNESIDGIAITVVATQNTVESDSFNNTYDANATYPVVAVGDVNTDGDTVIQDREKDPTVIATIPAGSTDAGKLTLVKTEGQTPANIEIITGTDAVTTEVRLEDQNGNKVTAADGKFFTIALQLEKKLNVIGFYHSETPLTKAESAEAVKAANDTYYYDAATGLLTFSTDDFSPFTVVTSSSVFNGGKGTKANPYLVATGEQALKMEDAKGYYFKLVDDIVVTDEIYLSGKTVTVDLNGHSIRLEYAAGVKPNNGSVFYIGGKKGNLTINDSSEGQTGAVYGSDKTYTNKVTSAVRAGNYGRLTINGGHFYGTSEGTSCIFVYTTMSSTSKATVTINGGKFETTTPSNGTYYVLNHQDNATAGCTITVNGGSFKNYNPGVTTVDPVNAKTGKITLGAGCTTTSTVDGSDTWYTVSK